MDLSSLTQKTCLIEDCILSTLLFFLCLFFLAVLLSFRPAELFFSFFTFDTTDYNWKWNSKSRVAIQARYELFTIVFLNLVLVSFLTSYGGKKRRGVGVVKEGKGVFNNSNSNSRSSSSSSSSFASFLKFFLAVAAGSFFWTILFTALVFDLPLSDAIHELPYRHVFKEKTVLISMTMSSTVTSSAPNFAGSNSNLGLETAKWLTDWGGARRIILLVFSDSNKLNNINDHSSSDSVSICEHAVRTQILPIIRSQDSSNRRKFSSLIKCVDPKVNLADLRLREIEKLFHTKPVDNFNLKNNTSSSDTTLVGEKIDLYIAAGLTTVSDDSLLQKTWLVQEYLREQIILKNNPDLKTVSTVSVTSTTHFNYYFNYFFNFNYPPSPLAPKTQRSLKLNHNDPNAWPLLASLDQQQTRTGDLVVPIISSKLNRFEAVARSIQRDGRRGAIPIVMAGVMALTTNNNNNNTKTKLKLKKTCMSSQVTLEPCLFFLGSDVNEFKLSSDFNNKSDLSLLFAEREKLRERTKILIKKYY